jgi:hypothetical protein
MQGNLKQIQLPEVLQFISMGKSTGLLTVHDGHGLDTTLMIRSGRIINSSALERQRRLGDLLVHRGILKRSVLSQVLALQRTIESDKRLGSILVEREIIQESQIREVLRLQLEEEIWNLFGIEEGEFRFDQVTDEKLGEATVQIDIEPLLLEGTRRQDEWRKIIRILPNDRLVLAVKRPAAEREKLKLDQQEWKVLAQVNGLFTIRAIVNRAGMGRFEVYQILASMVQRGILYIVDPLQKLHASQQNGPEQVPTSGQASAQQPAESAKPAGGLFGGLFGGASKRDEKGGGRHAFVSPVGALAYINNRMIDACLAAREYKAQPTDEHLIHNAWSDLLVSYPRADVVRVVRNHLDASVCETYIRNFEFAESTQDCYEDCLEALLQMLNVVYRLFAQRLGERTATRIAREALDEAGRITHQYGTDVRIAERAQLILKLQA